MGSLGRPEALTKLQAQLSPTFQSRPSVGKHLPVSPVTLLIQNGAALLSAPGDVNHTAEHYFTLTVDGLTIVQRIPVSTVKSLQSANSSRTHATEQKSHGSFRAHRQRCLLLGRARQDDQRAVRDVLLTDSWYARKSSCRRSSSKGSLLY